ncbi:YaaA family protein [Microbacterium sp. NPDC055903]
MKLLLPPSETKREGGESGRFAPAAVAMASLAPARRAAVSALVELAKDPDASRRALKLSDRQLSDIAHNRRLRTAPTMPAADRYTGVLYDALDARSLGEAARAHLHESVWIHSAPFGPLAALDPIPMYRLAAGTSVPGLSPLRRHWAEAVTAAIAKEAPSFLLDLRSEAYVALGPVPDTVPSAYVRVVTEEGRALNHFNKTTKGLFTRAFAEDGVSTDSPAELRHWAAGRGFVFRDSADDGVWELLAVA